MWHFISEMEKIETIKIEIGSNQFEAQANKYISNKMDSLERRVSFGEHYFHRSSSSSSYPSDQHNQILSLERNGDLPCASLHALQAFPVISHLQQNCAGEKIITNKKEKRQSISTIEKMKKLLQVESDNDSDYDKNDTKEREEKTRLVQEMLNTKVVNDYV